MLFYFKKLTDEKLKVVNDKTVKNQDERLKVLEDNVICFPEKFNSQNYYWVKGKPVPCGFKRLPEEMGKNCTWPVTIKRELRRIVGLHLPLILLGYVLPKSWSHETALQKELENKIGREVIEVEIDYREYKAITQNLDKSSLHLGKDKTQDKKDGNDNDRESTRGNNVAAAAAADYTLSKMDDAQSKRSADSAAASTTPAAAAAGAGALHYRYSAGGTQSQSMREQAAAATAGAAAGAGPVNLKPEENASRATCNFG